MVTHKTKNYYVFSDQKDTSEVKDEYKKGKEQSFEKTSNRGRRPRVLQHLPDLQRQRFQLEHKI